MKNTKQVRASCGDPTKGSNCGVKIYTLPYGRIHRCHRTGTKRNVRKLVG